MRGPPGSALSTESRPRHVLRRGDHSDARPRRLRREAPQVEEMIEGPPGSALPDGMTERGTPHALPPAPPGTAGANSAAGRTQLIDATAIHCNPSSALNLAKANPRLRPLHLVVRETEFCGLRLAGYFRRRMRENSRNSVRRPRPASLTDRNCEGFCPPGNRPGLSGLHGGGCRNRTDGHRSLASLQNEAARRGFSARNDLSQRMSKSLASKPKALTGGRGVVSIALSCACQFRQRSSRRAR